MIKPNFFIIGAPKCGTTALSEYLREHPRIDFSIPKEPVHFCTDFPNIRKFSDDQDYVRRCFGHCRTGELLAVGEGSTTYFYSAAAIPNILAFQPNAKFIIMLRNPLDMVPALHAEKLLNLQEDITDFPEAWGLAEERRRGEHIPKHCPDPRLVVYPDLGKLGKNLRRIFGQIPEEQRMVIMFEDFVADTRRVYSEVLAFLSVPDDGRNHFPKLNERKAIKNSLLYRFGCRPPAALIRFSQAAKRVLGIQRLNILPRLMAWTLKPVKSQPVSTQMRALMLTEFADDIDLLADLLERDLSHWKA